MTNRKSGASIYVVLREKYELWAGSITWVPQEGALGRLEQLMSLWQRYSRAMNLTASGTPAELVPHVVDGLETAACAMDSLGPREQSGSLRWLDVGSGAGFPGLVVAAVLRVEMVMFESRVKRAAFLELAATQVGPSKVRVERTRWDGSTWDGKSMDGGSEVVNDAYEVASARAVFAPKEWVDKGLAAVGAGGIVLLHANPSHLEGLERSPEQTRMTPCGVVAAYRHGARVDTEGAHPRSVGPID